MATRQAAVLPGQRLAPAPVTYSRDAAVVIGLAIVAAGVLQLLGLAWLSIPTGVVAVGLAVMIVVQGRRAADRAQVRDLLVESLAPYITVGRDLDRRMVRLGRGLPPDRVEVRYSPAVADDGPNWLATITGILSRRLDGTLYRLDKHDRRRCLLTFTPDTETAVRSAQEQRLDRALKSLIGASVKVTTFEVNGAGEVSRVAASHGEPAKAAVDGFRNRVQSTVGKMLPGRWRAQWDLTGDTVVFEQRPHMPINIWLPVTEVGDADELGQANYRRVKIPFGVNEDGAEMCWSPAVLPHLLMTGTTGSGKTKTAHNITATVARWGWPVWILDGKRVEFLGFRTWPNVQIVASEIHDQVALIRQVKRLVDRRYELIETGQASTTDFEPLYVVLDEYAEFVSTLSDWYPEVKAKGDPTRPPSLREVASIVRTARVARVHLLVTMQRPDVNLFGDRAGGEVRSNFGQRISMGRLDLQGAMMMWGNPHIGVTVPRAVSGRATAVDDNGVPVEAQCYRFPDLDAEDGTEQYDMLQRLRPATARHPRLLVEPPEVQLDLDTSAEVAFGFEDYANASWVLAAERPELDPVRRAELARTDDPDWGREASSTLASLGLHPDQRHNATSRRVTRPAGGTFAAPDEAIDGEFGYAGQQQLESAYDLDIGDQVLVDLEGNEDGGPVWVTVDEVPEADPSDPSMVMVSWRDDDDSSGVLLLPGDEPLTARKAVGWDRSGDTHGEQEGW